MFGSFSLVALAFIFHAVCVTYFGLFYGLSVLCRGISIYFSLCCLMLDFQLWFNSFQILHVCLVSELILLLFSNLILFLFSTLTILVDGLIWLCNIYVLVVLLFTLYI